MNKSEKKEPNSVFVHASHVGQERIVELWDMDTDECLIKNRMSLVGRILHLCGLSRLTLSMNTVNLGLSNDCGSTFVFKGGDGEFHHFALVAADKKAKHKHAVLAHEWGHYANGDLERRKRTDRIELAADLKAIEYLTRYYNGDEEKARRAMLASLRSTEYNDRRQFTTSTNPTVRDMNEYCWKKVRRRRRSLERRLYPKH